MTTDLRNAWVQLTLARMKLLEIADAIDEGRKPTYKIQEAMSNVKSAEKFFLSQERQPVVNFL